MPVGDCERAFAVAAERDGLVLTRAKVPWLNQRGHFGVPAEADSVRVPLERIFAALGGDPTAQRGKRLAPLPGDFLHEPSGTLIEIDESQHFTSFRDIALSLYPAETPLSFSIEEYRDLCATWAPVSDRYRASKPAVAFGPGGRQRQRAYHDSLRDLVTPAMGRPPVIRVAAPDQDGAVAYERVRGLLHERLTAIEDR